MKYVQNIVAQVWRWLIMKIILHNKIFELLRRQDLPCLLRLLSRLANPSQVTPPWRRLGDVNAGRWQEVSESGTGWLQARRATVPRAAQVLGPRTLHLPADPGPGKPQPPNNQYPSFLVEYFLLNQHVTPDRPKYGFNFCFRMNVNLTSTSWKWCKTFWTFVYRVFLSTAPHPPPL